MIEMLQRKLAEGLARRSIRYCSEWAQMYVVLGKPFPGPFGFVHHPWLKDMIDETGNWDGMKAAQMGYTTAALMRSMYRIDILREDVLYILPKRSPDATDFSKSKFDAILELSPHLSELFSNVRNVGHKMAGSVNFYLRGARSRTSLKTISAGGRVYDEFDEFPKGMATLADERSSGYQDESTQLMRLSTPSIPDYGIDLVIQRSSRDHYFFKCPKCGRQTELLYPDCLVVTADSVMQEEDLRRSHLRCLDCKRPLEHESKPEWLGFKNAHWESTAKRKAFTRGFEIDQLYSMAVPPWKIAEAVLKAQSDEAADQELYNSKLGKPRLTQGARVSEAQIDSCIGSYHMSDAPPTNQLITMGVDIGKVIHFQISQWMLPDKLGVDLNVVARKRVLHIGEVQEFDDLNKYLYDYQVLHTVCDANPDGRKAYEWASTHYGKITLCWFLKGINTRKRINLNPDTLSMSVHRTSWLDLAQNRFIKGAKSILLPVDVPQLYKRHVNNVIRKPEKDADGNPITKFISVGPDHYALVNLYDELALPMAVSVTEGKDISVYL